GARGSPRSLPAVPARGRRPGTRPGAEAQGRGVGSGPGDVPRSPAGLRRIRRRLRGRVARLAPPAASEQPRQLRAALSPDRQAAARPGGRAGPRRGVRLSRRRRRHALAQRPADGRRAGRGGPPGGGATAGGVPQGADPAVPGGPGVRGDRETDGTNVERGPEAVGPRGRAAGTGTGGDDVTGDGSPLDDAFTDWLAACDEAIAAGSTRSPTCGNAPPELGPRLERGLACLRDLHRLRPAARVAPPPPRVGRLAVIRELGPGGVGGVV